MKPPKNLEKYLSPMLAGSRLLYTALTKVLIVEHTRVRWEIKIWYYRDPAFIDHKTKFLVTSAEYHSGTEPAEHKPDQDAQDDEEEEEVLIK